MAKQTLYEILGLAENASQVEVEQAFDERRAALMTEADDDHRRNQLSFLGHAREVLAHPQRRADYDQKNKAALLSETETRAADATVRYLEPTANRTYGKLFFAVLIVISGIALAKFGLPRLTQANGNLTEAASPDITQATAKASTELPSIEDIEAALPPISEPSMTAPLTSSMPSTAQAQTPPQQAVQAQASMGVKIVVQGSPLIQKVLPSTYAIIGSQSLGTGVAVEADRLLTNCHVLAPNVLKGKIFAVNPVTGSRYEITEAAFLIKEDACVVRALGLAAQPIVMGNTAALQRGTRFHNIGFGGGKLASGEGQFLGNIVRSGQTYMISNNACVPGVSGGPLVDDEGRLIGLTSGGTADRRFCASLTVETARTVLAESMINIDSFPTNYLTNFNRRW